MRWTLIVVIFSFIFSLTNPIKIYSDLIEIKTVGKDLQLAEKKRANNYYIFQRKSGNKEMKIYMKTSTIFFLFEDGKGVKHIGYYWEKLSLLEKYIEIPFVGGRFEKIPQYKEIPDNSDSKKAVMELESMPQYPLSMWGSIYLFFKAWNFESFGGHS